MGSPVVHRSTVQLDTHADGSESARIIVEKFGENAKRDERELDYAGITAAMEAVMSVVEVAPAKG